VRHRTATVQWSGAPLMSALTSARTVHTLFTLLQTTVALIVVAPLGTSDSPVTHRIVRRIIAEQLSRNPKVASLKEYGPMRQTRVLFDFFCSFLLNLNLDLFIGLC
jgi:hypothetical protein